MLARKFAVTSAAWLCIAFGTGAQGALSIRADQQDYSISPGDTFSVRVLLDANDATLPEDTLPDGLFSYGLKLTFDPAEASVVDSSAIHVPAALDFSGVGPGAIRNVGSGFAAVKGNVSFSTFVPYDGTTLATFQVKDLGGMAPYVLGIEIYRTLGPSEAVFVDGQAVVLDSALSFRTSSVTPVPEPGVAGLLLVGLVAVSAAGLRRNRTGAA